MRQRSADWPAGISTNQCVRIATVTLWTSGLLPLPPPGHIYDLVAFGRIGGHVYSQAEDVFVRLRHVSLGLQTGTGRYETRRMGRL
jgi:hypothetical protein